MKKFLCSIISIAFYLITFLLTAEILLRTGRKNFLFIGFPLAVTIYFVFFGTLFYQRYQLNRWILWLWMNFTGYFLCWIGITIRMPMLWFNLGILFVMIPLTFTLFVAWGLVGIGFLFAYLLRRRSR